MKKIYNSQITKAFRDTRRSEKLADFYKQNDPNSTGYMLNNAEFCGRVSILMGLGLFDDYIEWSSKNEDN